MSAHAWFVRRVTYPLWQWRHGGEVLPTLVNLERTQWLPPEQIESLQLRRLKTLLAYAYEHSPYYREAFSAAGIRPQEIRSLSDLRNLPVLEKASLRDRGTQVMTEPRSRHLVKRQTSGSTGIPVVVWVEPKSRDAWTAARLRHMGWWSLGCGDRSLNLISRHDLTGWKWLKQYCFANVMEHSAMDLSEATLTRLHNRLTHGGVRVLIGYPSSLVYLARYVVSKGFVQPLTLQAVFSTGEVLHADQRDLLRNAFRCPIVNEYGSSEAGHIAGECPHGQMHIAAENVLLECEPCGSAPSPDQGEFLVTDLTNFATPLIRYRIGDLGTFGEPCSCGRRLPILDLRIGRVSDLVVLPNGQRMDFSVFDAVVDEISSRGLSLQQFRVIQHATDYVEILLAGPDSLSAAEESVRRRMAAVLGNEVHIVVRTVADLPPDVAGKRRRFISRVA